MSLNTVLLLIVGVTGSMCAAVSYFKGHKDGYECARRLLRTEKLPPYDNLHKETP